jgi:hypothetical protein
MSGFSAPLRRKIKAERQGASVRGDEDNIGVAIPLLGSYATSLYKGIRPVNFL